MELPENHIHFASRGGGPVHTVQAVYVNGVSILCEKDGIDITYGDGEPTVVTLRILPKTVTFGGEVSSNG